MRALARMYLLSEKGVQHDHDGAQGAFVTEVPRGMYAVGAKRLAQEFRNLTFEDQDLIPPFFGLTMQVQP
jgi:hypothetical protein